MRHENNPSFQLPCQVLFRGNDLPNPPNHITSAEDCIAFFVFIAWDVANNQQAVIIRTDRFSRMALTCFRTALHHFIRLCPSRPSRRIPNGSHVVIMYILQGKRQICNTVSVHLSSGEQSIPLIPRSRAAHMLTCSAAMFEENGTVPIVLRGTSKKHARTPCTVFHSLLPVCDPLEQQPCMIMKGEG